MEFYRNLYAELLTLFSCKVFKMFLQCILKSQMVFSEPCYPSKVPMIADDF